MLSSINSIYKSNRIWLVVTIITLSVLILFIVIKGKSPNMPTKIDDIKVAKIMDSLQVWTEQQRIIEQQNKLKYTQDSIRLSNIEHYVNSIPVLLQTINNKYDIQKRTINSLSTDQQFKFFTKWLSQEDSL